MTKDERQGYYDEEFKQFVHVHPALIELSQITGTMTDEQADQFSRWCHRWIEEVSAEHEVSDDLGRHKDMHAWAETAHQQLQWRAGMVAAKASGFLMESPSLQLESGDSGIVRRLKMMIVRKEPLT